MQGDPRSPSPTFSSQGACGETMGPQQRVVPFGPLPAGVETARPPRLRSLLAPSLTEDGGCPKPPSTKPQLRNLSFLEVSGILLWMRILYQGSILDLPKLSFCIARWDEKSPPLRAAEGQTPTHPDLTLDLNPTPESRDPSPKS